MRLLLGHMVSSLKSSVNEDVDFDCKATHTFLVMLDSVGEGENLFENAPVS